MHSPGMKYSPSWVLHLRQKDLLSQQLIRNPGGWKPSSPLNCLILSEFQQKHPLETDFSFPLCRCPSFRLWDPCKSLTPPYFCYLRRSNWLQFIPDTFDAIPQHSSPHPSVSQLTGVGTAGRISSEHLCTSTLHGL